MTSLRSTKGSFPKAGEGIPQGAILSPMLANFYLSTFDLHMQKRGFRVIRYADDFVVMCEDEAEAKRAYVVAKGYLEDELRLTVHSLNSQKTRIVQYHERLHLSWLRCSPGESTFPSQASIKKLLEKVDKAFEHPKGKPLLPIVVRISLVLSGWKESYKGSEMTEAAGRINTHVANCVTSFLRINGFTHDGRTVSAKQLCILGIPTI